MSNISLVTTKALRSVEVTFDTLSSTVESVGALAQIANGYVKEKSDEFRINSKFRSEEFRTKGIKRLTSITKDQIQAGKEYEALLADKSHVKYLAIAQERLAELDKWLAE